MTDMTFAEQMIIIAICAVTTMATRMLPFLLFKEGNHIPSHMVYLGKALPSAVFAMLVVYCLRNIDITGGTHGIPELIAVLVTVGVHLWKRNMFLSMAISTFCYMFIVQIIG